MKLPSRLSARVARLTPQLVVGMAAMVATAASAAPIVQAGVGSYNLGTDSSTSPIPTSSPQSPCGTGGQDALTFTGSGGNNIGIHSYSCGFGLYEFGSRSSGENTYYVDGSGSVIGDNLSVSGGGGFSVYVSPGQVGAFGSTSFGAGEYQHAELSIYLKIGNTVYLDEDWMVEISAGGLMNFSNTSSNSVGYDVASTFTSGPGYGSYAITGQSFFFNLADGVYDIEYVISSMARGKVTSTSSCRAVIGDGGEGAEGGIEEPVQTFALVGDGEGDGSFASYCGAGAQIGDPFNSAIARALPEPGSLGLAGLTVALLGLRSMRRRRAG